MKDLNLKFSPGSPRVTAALAKLKTNWNDRNIALSSKIRLMRSLFMSIFLYAHESWTLKADTERRIQAMEMRCLRESSSASPTETTSQTKRCETELGKPLGPTKTS